jgi:gas vesicle protein
MNASYKNTAKDVEEGVAAAADHLADKVRQGGKAVDDATATAKQTMADAGEAARDMAGSMKDAADAAVDEGRSRLGGVLRKAQDTAHDAKEAIVAGAGSTLTTVKDAAVEKADEARETLSDVGERLAATLQRASTESDSDALKSRVLSSVAQGLTTASDALRQRSVADLTSDVKALARRHPGAFMAAAAVAGFAAARFMRASSQRRLVQQDRDPNQGPRV